MDAGASEAQAGAPGGAAPERAADARADLAPALAAGAAAVVERVRVSGVVQGVGFRPFVWRLAGSLGLSGWVRNDSAGVEIEVAGAPDRIERFCRALRDQAPPLSRVDRVERVDRLLRQPALPGPGAPQADGSDEGFRILPSAPGATGRTAIGPDVAVCEPCLAELLAPGDRRYRYPFINCTQCGPRFTITVRLPYDRAQTSMAPFALCPACHHEYTTPASRRFHAEPNACPACGPRLSLLPADGAAASAAAVDDPIAAAVALLGAGAIVAIKALGGFHLACDARNREAVAALRGRKLREAKPLAVLVAGLPSLTGLVEVDQGEAALLTSPERPIVLLRKRPGSLVDQQLPGVAPGMAELGVMLPCTPIQYLLFHEAAGRPAGTGWLARPQPLVLVMTSANPGGEPLVIDNHEAMQRLAGIADALLVHDRAILLRCDDSVARSGGSRPRLVRRARGYSPRAIELPAEGPSVLALGAALKNTACLTRGAQAFLSPHVGDLDNAPTCLALEQAARHLEVLLESEPRVLAHDRHPDFYSTRLAERLAAERGLALVAVQHHHAHIAAVCAEHGVRGPVLGLALDGVGLGDQQRAWGGELLRVDGPRFVRLGHLRELPLPGGDRAARQPWRMGAAALWALGRGDQIASRFAGQRAAPELARLLDRAVRCPPTSSAGRLFDAAAALLGVRAVARFEGEAAMELEGLAAAHGPEAPLLDALRLHGGVLDLLPLLSRLADEPDPARGAARFHSTLAAGLDELVAGAARAQRLDTVALGGGCFLNRVLSRDLGARLLRRGLRVLSAEQAPPNDGGLALGQAWVAMQAVLEGEVAAPPAAPARPSARAITRRGIGVAGGGSGGR